MYGRDYEELYFNSKCESIIGHGNFIAMRTIIQGLVPCIKSRFCLSNIIIEYQKLIEVKVRKKDIVLTKHKRDKDKTMKQLD